MPRLAQRISANEILDILNQQYLNVTDIKKVASVSIERARQIRNSISQKLEDENYFVPTNLIPTESLIDYLHLNLNYLKKISKNFNYEKGVNLYEKEA